MLRGPVEVSGRIVAEIDAPQSRLALVPLRAVTLHAWLCALLFARRFVVTTELSTCNEWMAKGKIERNAYIFWRAIKAAAGSVRRWSNTLKIKDSVENASEKVRWKRT